MVTSREGQEALAAHFDVMAAGCARHGSPLYADLAAWVAHDVRSGGASIDALADHLDARADDLVPLRFFAAIHLLVLSRQAPGLGVFYPSVGGTAPSDDNSRARCRAALDDVIRVHSGEIALGLARVPQTNDVGRVTGLAAMLREIGRAFVLPMRLMEIGCSAGLSLRVDALVDGGVVFAEGEAAGPIPRIAERRGCDLRPLDPGSMHDRMVLTSYVWPDDAERFERLRRALEVAGTVRATVVSQDALGFVRDLELRDGYVTVLWHSAMRPYLEPVARQELDRRLRWLGERATPSSPFVHIGLEPDDDSGSRGDFMLSVTSWPGLPGVPAGVRVDRASTPPHGVPVTWSVTCVGGVVHDAGGRLLVVRRAHAPAAGMWSIPGGRVEAGESLVDAVRREVLEETGIDIVVGDLVGVVNRTGPDSHYVIHDFAARPVDIGRECTPCAADDALETRWVTLDELQELPVTQGLMEALADWGCLPR